MFHEVGMARLTLLPFLIKNKLYRRSFTLSLFLVILIAWLQVQASHNKVWPDSVAILPSGAIDNCQSSFSTERFMGAPVRPPSNSTTQKTLLR
jgi:hypothetical protein